MNYINKDFFLITLGIFFSLPNSGEIFLQYLSPIILRDAINPTIPLIVFIIWILVTFGALFGIADIIQKYHKMRGIITNNHGRNICIGMILGMVVGIALDIILF